jgi:acyl-coenzyme A thioesterase PaaI-like protein
MSLVREGVGILTTEFKINLVAPAAGDRIIARARVVKPGRTLALVQANIFAESKGNEKLIALLTATMMAIEGRDGILD